MMDEVQQQKPQAYLIIAYNLFSKFLLWSHEGRYQNNIKVKSLTKNM